MTFKDLVDSLIDIVNDIVVPVIFLLMFLVFIWGVVNYFFLNRSVLTTGSDGKSVAKRTQGREFVYWGVLALVVAFGTWTIVNLLLSTLGIAPNP